MASNEPDEHTKQHRGRLKSILKHDVAAMRVSEGKDPVRVSRDSQPTHREHKHKHAAKFDEVNIAETLHPVNKDYGHMKVDEPKTPFEPSGPNLKDLGGIDPATLIKKLANYAERENQKPVGVEDAVVPATAGFHDARKEHYSEYQSVKKARELIAKELSELEKEEPPPPPPPPPGPSKG